MIFRRHFRLVRLVRSGWREGMRNTISSCYDINRLQ